MISFYPWLWFQRKREEEAVAAAAEQKKPKDVFTCYEENFIAFRDGSSLVIKNKDSRLLPGETQWYFESVTFPNGDTCDQLYLPADSIRSIRCNRSEFWNGEPIPLWSHRYE